MFRTILAALLAAVVMFQWGWLYWGVLPLADRVTHRIPQEDAVVQVLAENLSESGAYYFPGRPQHDDRPPNPNETEAAWNEKHAAGPIGWVLLQKQGAPAMDPQVLGLGFGAMFVAALIAAGLLSICPPANYARRVIFVAALGLFVAVIGTFNDAIWFAYPWDFQLIKATYQVIGWILAGLVIAAIVKAPCCVVPAKQ